MAGRFAEARSSEEVPLYPGRPEPDQAALFLLLAFSDTKNSVNPVDAIVTCYTQYSKLGGNAFK